MKETVDETTQTEDDVPKVKMTDEELIAEVVRLTSEIYDLSYAK